MHFPAYSRVSRSTVPKLVKILGALNLRSPTGGCAYRIELNWTMSFSSTRPIKVGPPSNASRQMLSPSHEKVDVFLKSEFL